MNRLLASCCGALVLLGLTLASDTEAAMIEIARYEFESGSAASADLDSGTTASDYDPRSAAIGGSPTESSISSGAGNAFMRARNTPGSSSPVDDTNNFYHTFSITVDSLPAGKALNLESLDFDYGPNTSANFGGSSFFAALYSPSTGLVNTTDKLGGPTLAAAANNVGTSASIDLTVANPVAGDAFNRLSEGDSIEFRLYFGDNSSSQSRIHRVDNIVLLATLVPEPMAAWLTLSSLGMATLVRRRL